jgi:hypothetical protein
MSELPSGENTNARKLSRLTQVLYGCVLPDLGYIAGDLAYLGLPLESSL